MIPSRALTLLLAAVLVVGGIAYGLTRGGDEGPGGGESTTAREPAGAVVVDFAYSPEKEQLLAPLLDEFNTSGAEVDGAPVRVRGEVVSSGQSADKISSGALKPALWSPASSLWGRLVNQRTDSALAPDESPSLVRSPLVIAMPEPLARALGWPATSLGWADILAEANSATGWAAHGHPEWGRFKFGQTNPDFSTSGLSATVAEYLVAAGKTEGLTLADIRRAPVRRFVSDIQRSVVHYGDTTLFFAEQMAKFGPTYVSAVAMEEVTVLDYNRRLRTGGPKLVAIYPREGTFYSDNPLISVAADWVSPAQAAGAKLVSDFLVAKATPERAAASAFRSADSQAAVPEPITAANGADPAQPTRLLSLPEPKVLDAILAAWRTDRKPAHIEVVLDISGSMQDEDKLESAKRGLVRFLNLLQPQDEVGLSVFSDAPTLVQAPIAMRVGRKDLIARVEGLGADGGTAVYDATDQAVARIAADAKDTRISAVVVLTDGADNQSSLSPGELGERLTLASGSEGPGVRVFTIAYGSGAEQGILEQIAAAGGGRAYTGDPQTIERVYIQISSFF
jgi:Ca-activated chloride channel family protein